MTNYCPLEFRTYKKGCIKSECNFWHIPRFLLKKKGYCIIKNDIAIFERRQKEMVNQ